MLADEPPRDVKRWCRRCPQHGRLLPSGRGMLTCVECGGETHDTWGDTDHLTKGDFDAFAGYARQLKELKAQQRECPHREVVVSCYPYCGVCGLVLPRDHPTVQLMIAKYGDGIMTPEPGYRPKRVADPPPPDTDWYE